MERMSQELSIDNYDLRSVKKMYNNACKSNTFLNQYTLLDVEDGKKRLYLDLVRKYNNSNIEYIERFIEESSKMLANELFEGNGRSNTQMVGVKNIIKDQRKLNPTYFNETYRIVNIDSMYRENLWSSNYEYNSKTSTDMSIYLNDML